MSTKKRKGGQAESKQSERSNMLSWMEEGAAAKKRAEAETVHDMHFVFMLTGVSEIVSAVDLVSRALQTFTISGSDVEVPSSLVRQS